MHNSISKQTCFKLPKCERKKERKKEGKKEESEGGRREEGRKESRRDPLLDPTFSPNNHPHCHFLLSSLEKHSEWLCIFTDSTSSAPVIH